MCLERELARRRRSAQRDQVEWLAVGSQMIKNPLDDIGLLNARDHPKRPAAAPTPLSSIANTRFRRLASVIARWRCASVFSGEAGPAERGAFQATGDGLIEIGSYGVAGTPTTRPISTSPAETSRGFSTAPRVTIGTIVRPSALRNVQIS